MQAKTIVFGTFDIIHPGHRSFLRQVKKYGEYLIVVIARDKTVKKIKGRPENGERKRLRNMKDSGLADEVILGSLVDKYAAIKKYRPDVICLGYDQKYFTQGLKEELKKTGLEKTKIIRLKSYKPEIYKTSKLRGKKMTIEILINKGVVALLLRKKQKTMDSLIFSEERRLSERLLPEIDKLIKKNKLAPTDIAKITVKSDLGPNFTTYRIAKTVAESWNWNSKYGACIRH
jgi:FAD synthetase